MWIFDIKHSGDGRWLLSSCSDGRLLCWDLDNIMHSVADYRSIEDELSDLKRYANTIDIKAHDSPIYTLVESQGLVFTGSDEEIRIWKEPWSDSNSKHWVELRIPQLEGSRGSLSPLAETNGLAVTPDGSILTAAAGDGNAYEWDVQTQKLLGTYKGHKDCVQCVKTCGNIVASGSEDGTCRLWDRRLFKCVSTIECGSIVSSLSFSPNGNWLAMGGMTDKKIGSLAVANVASRVVTSMTERKDRGCIHALSYSDDNLILAGDTSVVEFWNSTGNECLVDVPTTNITVFAVEFCKNRQILATSGSSPIIDIFSSERSHVVSLSA